jgi:hypothetical protein
MGIVLGLIFLLCAIAALVVYNGTPHGGPTTVCGPITVFQHTFNINADCRYISVGELLVALLFFFLAVISVLSARPRRPVR